MDWDQTETFLSPSNLRGRIISHYRLDEFLGQGGMGLVWKAEDLRLKRPAAIKFLPAFDGATEQAKQRFSIEAQAAAALDHPSVCTIYEIGEEAGVWFLAMAYVDGESVARKVLSGPLELALALQIGAEVADGLAAAHAREIIHRDIKSGNIMVTRQNHAKILDFGLARVNWSAGLTGTGMAVGTPSYMSPEQVSAGELDHRTDLWALGVVLYEMLAGQVPFHGDYREALYRAILDHPPPGLRARRPEIPSELEALVYKALAKSPDERHQSAAELRDELQALRGERGPSSTSSVRGSGRLRLAVLPSIAVLPFANLTSDPANEYFTDGLTDELISALASLRNIRVVSRTSVFAMKGKAGDIKEIGKRLRVGSVLEGSVRRAANRVRINVQLVNVEDEFPIWSDRYDEEMNDILQVQEDIAQKVVVALRVRLGDEGRFLANRRAASPEAYRLYLEGRYHIQQMNPLNLIKARECFEKAIEEDPEYAPAHGGLARYYCDMAHFSAMAPMSALPNGLAAAQRALELDGTLAVAHVTLAEIVLTLEWDWAGAEGHFREAIRLAPGDAYVRQPFARILSRQGRFDEAHQLLIEALDLDPLSKPAMNSIAYVYVSARRYEEALEACRRVLDIDPTYFETVACQAQAYSALGRHEEAIAASAVCRRVSRDSAAAVAVYAYFSGIAGRHEEARVLRDQLVERSQAGYVSPAFISFADIGLGEYEKAFERLNLACEIHDPFVTFLGVSPVFDPLRSDPRFPALLQKVGFPASFHPSVLHIRSTSRNT